jgi:hypothetical protein
MKPLHLFCIAIGSVALYTGAHATVLTFDINGETNQEMIPLAYGDHVGSGGAGDNVNFMYGSGGGSTANIGVDYWTNDTSDNPYDHELKFWNTGYGDLTNVAYMSVTGGYGQIEFIPDAGYSVTINSCDFGDWLEDETGLLQVVDANKNVLWSNSNFLAPHAGHASYAPDITSSGPISIEWANSWNMGIDNVSFSESAAPEPASLLALCAGAIGLVSARRRR